MQFCIYYTRFVFCFLEGSESSDSSESEGDVEGEGEVEVEWTPSGAQRMLGEWEKHTTVSVCGHMCI